MSTPTRGQNTTNNIIMALKEKFDTFDQFLDIYTIHLYSLSPEWKENKVIKKRLVNSVNNTSNSDTNKRRIFL